MEAIDRDAPLEVEPLTLSYVMDQAELLRCVPALNRGTTFSVIGGGLLAALALLNVLLADPLMALIVGAFAVALLTGWYCIPFSWLGLRLAGERARMPIAMTVDEFGLHLRQGSSNVDVAWSSVRRIGRGHGHLFVYCAYPRAFLVPERAFGPGQLDRFLSLAEAGRGRPTDDDQSRATAR
jgi:hypothetical protein